jgi:hypothetical protein
MEQTMKMHEVEDEAELKMMRKAMASSKMLFA